MSQNSLVLRSGESLSGFVKAFIDHCPVRRLYQHMALIEVRSDPQG